MTSLHVGAAKVDITPGWPVALDGFAHRTEPATWAAQPLHVRVAVLRSHDRMTTATAVIVSADILEWPAYLVNELRPQLARVAGTTTEMVLLAATHTHSAPVTGKGLPNADRAADQRFVNLLRERTVEAVSDAVDDLQAVRVRRTSATYPLGTYRRVVVDGEMRLGLNPVGPVDHELTVVTFEGADRMQAVFVHYTCHPVISDLPEISGEYPGVAMGEIERSLGGVALFLQGCCGDIDPDFTGTMRIRRAGNDEIIKTGKAVAQVVEQAIAEPGRELDRVTIRAHTASEELWFRHVPTLQEIRRHEQDDDLEGRRSRMFLARPELLVASDALTFQRLDLADGLSLLAMNGEIVVEYGLRIKAVSGGVVLPMGYSNGMIGYVPTARQIEEGGYEGIEAALRAFKPSAYEPGIEARIFNRIDTMAMPISVGKHNLV